jgi:hypothetical protein
VSTSLAYGQFFTYSQRLTEEERQVYPAGAFDTVVSVTEARGPMGFEDLAALPEMHTRHPHDPETTKMFVSNSRWALAAPFPRTMST